MNEYEIATLASRNLGHWIAVAQVFATLIIGAGQIAIVWYGIRAMNRASNERTRDRRQQAQAQERHAQAQERRHTETMAALDMQRRALETLIERTAPARAGQ